MSSEVLLYTLLWVLRGGILKGVYGIGRARCERCGRIVVVVLENGGRGKGDCSDSWVGINGERYSE